MSLSPGFKVTIGPANITRITASTSKMRGTRGMVPRKILKALN